MTKPFPQIRHHLEAAHYFTGRLHRMQNTCTNCNGVTEELTRLVNAIHAEIAACIEQMKETQNE